MKSETVATLSKAISPATIKANRNPSTATRTILMLFLVMAFSLGLHSQNPTPQLELGVAGFNVPDYNGGQVMLDSTKVAHFRNNTNKVIKSLKFTFDPIKGAEGLTTGNGTPPWFDPKNGVKLIKDKNGDVTGVEFSGKPYITKGGKFLIDATTFPKRTITMTATLGPQLVMLDKAVSPELGTAGVDYVSISGSAFPTGEVNIANVVVEFATTCQSDASAATSSASIVNGTEGTKILSFLLPSGLSPGQYFVSISDLADGDANFESSNCSAVSVVQ